MKKVLATMRSPIFFAILVLMTFGFMQDTIAQPTLDFRRIIVEWPTINLWFQVRCANDVRYDFTKGNFKVVENGVPIGEFELWCPDPNEHCCISVALVIDRSGSMSWGNPSGMEGAKAGSKAFVDAMDGGCDEATLISFASTVSVDVFMTNDRDLLKAGIDALVPIGGTAVWDGGVAGVNELVNNGTQACRAVILLTDGEDNSSSNTPADIIALALSNKIRVFTIGLGTSINEADLQQIATDTGGKFYLAPNPSQLIAIYNEISTIIGGNWLECKIWYTAKCPDGTRRNVDLTLLNLLGCPGPEQTKTKSYKAPRDTSQFTPLTIKLGQETVRGGQTANIPLILETSIDNELLQISTFKILFDETCCQYTGYETKGYLLDGVPLDVSLIAGGIQVKTTKAKLINGQGILAMFKFKASDPEQDTECPLKLFGWTFESGCFRPVLLPGKIIIEARRPEVECDIDMLQELIFDKGAKNYSPNPFVTQVILTNKGDREARNGSVTISFDKNSLQLVTPLTMKQYIAPKDIKPNSQGVARWDLFAKRRVKGDSIEVCFDITFDNHPPVHCCKKIWIPPTAAILECKLSAPKINLDVTKTRYVPMPFTVTADIWNDGGLQTDTLYARIEYTPDLMLHPNERSRTIKLVQPFKLQPGQHGTVSWDLIHPVSLDQKDYNITVCVRNKNIDSTCCEIPITIPPLNAPQLRCNVTMPKRLSYDSTLDVYFPNPFAAKVSVQNMGGLDADSVRAMIVLPADLVLDPPSQPLTKYFNPMKVVQWKSTLPANELTWSVRCTKRPRSEKCYTVQFILDGVGPTGLPVDQVYCSDEVCVPPINPLLSCELLGPDSLVVNATGTGVTPNPFDLVYVIKNVGRNPIKVIDAFLSMNFLQGTASGVIITNPQNPIPMNRTLNPGDTASVTYNIQVINQRTMRVVKFTVAAIDEDGEPVICDKIIPIAAIEVELGCSAQATETTIKYNRLTATHEPLSFKGSFDMINAGGLFLQNVEVELYNMPPELVQINPATLMQTIPIIQPMRSERVTWDFALTDSGRSLTAGKTVRVGVRYKSESTPLIEGDCFFDIFIEPVIKPQLECSLLGPDTIRFIDNQYQPEEFDIDLEIRNTGTGPADDVKASVLQDTRFNIVPPSSRDISILMDAGATETTKFRLRVNPKTFDGNDTVRVVVYATGTAPAYCELPIFVYHEQRPQFVMNCTATPNQLAFNDALNDYVPNPFTVQTIATNIGETFADNCQFVFVGPSRFTPASGSPVLSAGTSGKMNVGQKDTAYWSIRALRRDVGGWDTLVFQIQGQGGMGPRIVIGECRVPVYVPPARSAQYTLQCTITPDSLRFQDGQYIPDPFLITAVIQNTGQAVGQSINATLVFPPGLTLSKGETVVKRVKDLNVGDTAIVTWSLKPLARKDDATLDICVSAKDRFSTEGKCCSKVFIPLADNAALKLTAHCPESLRVDPIRGEYQNNPFTVTLNVLNNGSQRADSVYVLILPQSQDLKLINPTTPGILIGSLDRNGQRNVTWQIMAMPRTTSGPIEIRYLVTAKGLAPIEIACNVIIPQLGQPSLICNTTTTPKDTLHFLNDKGDYEGTASTLPGKKYTVFEVKTTVNNIGKAQARDIYATILLPDGTTLEEGENAVKQLTPLDLIANESGVVAWKIRPLRKGAGMLRRFKVLISSDKALPSDCYVDLFIQGAPKLADLTIPSDNIGQYGDKVFIPIMIDETVGKDVASYDLTITYSPNVVRFIEPIAKGSMTEYGWNGPRAKQMTPNSVLISDYTTGTPILSGAGTLIYMVFEGVAGGPGHEMDIEKSSIAFEKSSSSINGGEVQLQTTDGEVTISGSCITPIGADATYSLKQNRPNPFNPSTQIEYTIPEDTYATLKVFDPLGRIVATLVEGNKLKGTYTVMFNAGELPSGTYYYKLETKNYSKILRMTLAR